MEEEVDARWNALNAGGSTAKDYLINDDTNDDSETEFCYDLKRHDLLLDAPIDSETEFYYDSRLHDLLLDTPIATGIESLGDDERDDEYEPNDVIDVTPIAT